MSETSKEILNPSVPLLAKLSAVVVHADEWLTEQHPFDLAALKSVVYDPEVQAWIENMTTLALAPSKRHKST